MQEHRRWYDSDPVLKEALELLRIQPDDKQLMACDYLLELQENVAQNVLEHISGLVKEYSDKGNRWYDKDETLLKAVELLRLSPPKVQRVAALKLLLSLERQDQDDEEVSDEK